MFLAHGVTTIFDLGNTTHWILAAKGAEQSGRLRGPRIFTSGDVIDRRRTRESGFGGGSHSSPHMAYVESPAQARQVARSLMAKGADLLKVYQNLTWEELKAVTEEAHKVDVAVVGHTNNLWEAVKNGLDGVTHLWPVALSLMSPENLQAYEENRIACPAGSTKSSARSLHRFS